MRALIKKMLSLKSGSGKPNTEKVGKMTMAQVQQIAKEKLADLNTSDIDAASKIVAGTARSMGIDVV
jgi:large subunit ribosomal protein L11